MRRHSDLSFVLLLLAMILVVAFVVLVERGERRIPVQYAKRMVGRRLMGGQSTHLPLKVNAGGVIPVIFASGGISFGSRSRNRSTASASPCTSMLTPAGVLAINPVSPHSFANRYTYGRNPTPCTIPVRSIAFRATRVRTVSVIV